MGAPETSKVGAWRRPAAEIYLESLRIGSPPRGSNPRIIQINQLGNIIAPGGVFEWQREITLVLPGNSRAQGHWDTCDDHGAAPRLLATLSI